MKIDLLRHMGHEAQTVIYIELAEKRPAAQGEQEMAPGDPNVFVTDPGGQAWQAAPLTE